MVYKEGESEAKIVRKVTFIRIRCEKVEEGFIPEEKTVYLKRADGALEEVTVSTKNLRGKRLEASEIGRTANKILVELPRESAAGRWRVWVRPSSVGA